ncbi:MAG: YopX family protein [Streptococcus mitis]|nr:YopX family protein [Streptococcus mitis]
MILKFRAWLKKEQKMDNYIDHISWLEDELYCIGDGITYMVSAEDLELMQSTGLKDKNGKEVFVGDIIKCIRGCLHEVYIEKEYGGTYFGGMPAVYLKDLREGYAWTEHEEIIGNIYENPELLEVKE